MQDILSLLHSLKRPRLLIRAARIGVQDYQRSAHLPRLLGYGTLPRTGPALMRLMEIESELNARREASDAGYSIARHVELLVAMMGEARVLRSAGQT